MIVFIRPPLDVLLENQVFQNVRTNSLEGKFAKSFNESFDISIIPMTESLYEPVRDLWIDSYCDEWRFTNMFGPLEVTILVFLNLLSLFFRNSWSQENNWQKLVLKVKIFIFLIF